MLRKAVSRVAMTLAAITLFVTGSVTDGFAQGSTGRIIGRVTSADGQPVASARVLIVGTGQGNITDARGNYFINNVAAGRVTVRAEMIGFQPQEVREQLVVAGNSITIDFKLTPAAVELEALVVTGERNPLVPRDQVASRTIVTGETIDKLPFDQAGSIVRLQPGVISTNRGYSIRGSREGEEAVFVDGIPIRRLQNGNSEQVEVPTNGLAQVDVTTGGISSRFGNAQSGVINYVTKSGGTTYSGSAAIQSGDLAPKWWRNGFTRGELSFGGPVPGVNRLSFFSALTLEGNKYSTSSVRQETRAPNYVIGGLDTIIRMPRTNASGQSGCTNSVGVTCDSVDIFVPEYIDFAESMGIRNAGSSSDESVLTTKLTYGLGGGSKIDLSYNGNRDQSIGWGTSNFESQSGSYSTAHMLTASGYFLLNQAADHALALDVKASYQRNFSKGGPLDLGWLNDHTRPFMGYQWGGLDFIVEDLHEKYPINERQILASRSRIIPSGLDYLFKDNPEYLNYGETTSRSGAAGLPASIRLTPYGGTVTTQGIGSNPGHSWSQNSRVYTTASIDYQMTRYNRVWLGAEMTAEDNQSFSIGTFSGSSSMSQFKPNFGGAFFQDRLDIGDVVLEVGLRYDRFDPNYYFPRIPGYAATVPDSLQRDKWVDPGYQGVCGGVSDEIIAACVASGKDTSFLSRIKENTDCGGEATAAKRTNANGEVVCKDNFIASRIHTALSPKIAVSFPVTTSSTFRLSYGQNTQAPPMSLMFASVTGDGGAGGNASYGREVDIPRTVLFEAGYRQVFGGNTVVDVSAYSKTNRNALSYRKISFVDPNNGSTSFINVLQNADYSLARGVDISLDRRVTDLLDLNVNYSYVDARGTGSDPSTYTNIFARATSNLSAITTTPPDAPEVLLPLDQSRAHTVASTMSLQFPSDFASDNRIVNAILGDVGVYTTARVMSGLPYTRLRNQNNGETGPPTSTFFGEIDEALNSSRTPMQKLFDARITKGFSLFNKRMSAFADFRNPLDLENTNSVYLETGQVTHNALIEQRIFTNLSQSLLDGDILVDDFRLCATPGGVQVELSQCLIGASNPNSENKESAVNRYNLIKVERQWGNGDGIFTVAEQRNLYERIQFLNDGPQNLRNSIQSMRLGLEINF